ncbi:hypothetical protein B5P19_15670 [Clavibacter sepedonicus]|uniref:Membrane protein n=1 Tax=Clavibacter sepedonicus TaxID=31964 RepID=B0RJG6_CLASE|nr:hypothetical protein B5P19_15670 [Clavibacter sepedonicus]CAQ03356.1 putative membrane protein [Clavibacter sepedonicus]
MWTWFLVQAASCTAAACHVRVGPNSPGRSPPNPARSRMWVVQVPSFCWRSSATVTSGWPWWQRRTRAWRGVSGSRAAAYIGCRTGVVVAVGVVVVMVLLRVGGRGLRPHLYYRHRPAHPSVAGGLVMLSPVLSAGRAETFTGAHAAVASGSRCGRRGRAGVLAGGLRRSPRTGPRGRVLGGVRDPGGIRRRSRCRCRARGAGARWGRGVRAARAGCRVSMSCAGCWCSLGPRRACGAGRLPMRPVGAVAVSS